MVVFLYDDMVPVNHKGNPPKFSIEDLRKFPGNESLSDDQLERQATFLLEYSIILYQLYLKMGRGTESVNEMEVIETRKEYS